MLGGWTRASRREKIEAVGVSLMPLDADVHLVLCSFGRAGLAYVEADPAESDASTIVRNLLYGQIRPSIAGGRNER